MKKYGVLILLLVVACFAMAQIKLKPKLLAGPVVGSVTKNSARIWIAYRGKGQNALILGDTADKKVYYPTNVNYITNKKGDVALTMD
ncbi:MAG TPA: hypothetical protein VK174_18635, partial [Chitinophagales bacterium]|nr:hypothetical protein [Chitinophagales bacterium]